MHTFTFPTTLRSVALVAMVALGACSKKDDDATPATTYASTWTADSKNYTATTSSSQVSNSTLSLGLIQSVSNSESYTVSLAVPAATGTYNLASGSNLGAYGVTTSGTQTAYLASSGTVTITTYSATEVIGTFSFTASTISTPATTKTVSNGKFAIKR